MARTNLSDTLFLSELPDELAMDGIPIDTAWICDAYQKDDFWLPPSTVLVEPCYTNDVVEATPKQHDATATTRQAENGWSDASAYNHSPRIHQPCDNGPELVSFGEETPRESWRTDTPFYSSKPVAANGSRTALRLWQVQLVLDKAPKVCFLSQNSTRLFHSSSIFAASGFPESEKKNVASFCGEEGTKSRLNDGHIEMMEQTPESVTLFTQEQQVLPISTAAKAPTSERQTLLVKTSRQRPKSQSKLDRAKAKKVMPVPPLTAYNYYFRVERDRLLQRSNSDDGNNDDSNGSHPLAYVLHQTLKFQNTVLLDQWGRDPNAKRQHSNTHGRMSFGSLTARIAASWNVLPTEIKNVFGEISARDFERYSIQRRKLIPQAECQM